MLLRLPDELLLHIALNLSNNTCLTNLALTRRSFRNVACECLLRNASIPLRSIPQFIVLVSHHPGWAHSITHIELRDDSAPIEKVPYNVSAIKLCRTLISNTWRGPDHIAIQFALQLYHTSPVLWTALLFAALPHAKSLLIQPQSDDLPLAYEFILREYTRIHANNELLAQLETYVLNRLQALEVHSPSPLYPPIAVCHLTNLRTLVVDGACLRPKDLHGFGTHQQWILQWTRPPGSLPAGLKTLHIHGDAESMPWTWLHELQWHQSPSLLGGEPEFADLSVRLFFDMPCRSRDGRTGVADFINSDLNHEAFGGTCVVRLLWEFFKMDVDFQTYFRLDSAEGMAGHRYEQKSLFAWIEIVRRENLTLPLPWMEDGEKERLMEAKLEEEREVDKQRDEWWAKNLALDKS